MDTEEDSPMTSFILSILEVYKSTEGRKREYIGKNFGVCVLSLVGFC